MILGSASQSPTRERNHNGYFLRWDGHGVLFDPGEGTQRQFTHAGVSPATITRICISHFHGDHCLGLPGVIMRMALDHAHLPIPIHYPSSGEEYYQRLRFASAGQEGVEVDACPVTGSGVIARDETFTIRSAPLTHRVDSIGYRLEEPDGRHMLPERLMAAGISGPDVGRLLEEGSMDVGGRTVTLEEVSEPRKGQVFAYLMDTALCAEAVELARGADLLLTEATFLDRDADMAAEYGHLTAGQAGRIAAEAGARKLVLSHFSRRYEDMQEFIEEAGAEFGDVVLAHDLDHIEFPKHV